MDAPRKAAPSSLEAAQQTAGEQTTMRINKTVTIAASLILALPALLAATAQATAQTTAQPDSTVVNQFPESAPPPPPADNTPTLHITTREVVVDVEVYDDAGNPVHGLTQSDFTIEENGKPQPLRTFREFSKSAQAAESASPKLPYGVYTNSQSVPTTGPVNILLFDAMHSRPEMIVHSLQYASDYFSTMPKGTLVAIFWFSDSGLHMLQGFTSDRVTLQRALHNIHIEVRSNLEHHTIEWYTIDMFNQIAAYVSGIKGRKNLLWIVPGMPVNLMRDGGWEWPDAHDMTIVHRLMDTYERFSAEQIAVSPVDPSGVVGLGIPQLKAEEVAEQSGGEAFYNNNDLKSLIAKAIDHGSQFYTLSYIPPKRKDDGHYHHIKVEISNHSGLHLVYRKGYDAERVPTLDAPAPGPALMKASMEGNAPGATQILFDAAAWPSPPAASPTEPDPAKPATKKAKVSPKGLIPYEVHYGFPSNEIAFTEDADGMLNGSIEFDITAYDDYRKLVGHLSQTVTFHLSVADYDEFMSKPFHYTQKLALPLGQLSFHLGILDNVTSKVGTLEIPLTVQPYKAGPPQRASAPCPPRCPLPTPPAASPPHPRRVRTF